MKGKYKLFVIGLVSLCASISVASAKSMTAAEIAEAITAQNPNATYAYVIGSYVYSGSHMLSTKDVMVASKTIESNDPDDQYINVLSLNESTNKWEYEKNLLGSLIASSTGAVDVQYIDYEPTSDSVNVDKTVADEITKLGDAENNAVISIDKNVITVKVSDTISSSTYTTLAEDIINLLSSNDKIASIVISQLDADGKVVSNSAIAITKNTSKSTISSKFSTLASANSSFTIEVKLVDGVVNAGKYTTYNVNFVSVVDTNKFFTSNKLTNGDYYTFDCTESENGNCSLVLDLKKINTTTAGPTSVSTPSKYSEHKFDALVNAIKGTNGALNNIKVKSVTIKIGDTINVFTSNSTTIEIGNSIASAFAIAASKSTDQLVYSDLLNQKITITILVDSTKAVSQNDKNEEVYSVTITGTTDSSETMTESVKSLNAAKGASTPNSNSLLNYNPVFDEETNTITFELPEGKTSIVPFKSNSDLVDVISDLYFSGLYESVTVSGVGVDPFILDSKSEGKNKGEIFKEYLLWLAKFGGEGSIIDYFTDPACLDNQIADFNSKKNLEYETLSSKVVVVDNSTTPDSLYNTHTTGRAFNMSNLAGKSFTITLKYANEAIKDESGVTVYTVKFANSINTSTDTNTLLGDSGLNNGNSLATSSTSVPAKTNEFVYGLDIDKASTNLNTDEFGSQLRTISQKYESIVINYNGKDYTIKYTDKTSHEVSDYGQLDDLLTDMKANKTINASLQGKTLKITYNLKSDSTNLSKNGETYTIKFAIETNINSILNAKMTKNDKLVAREISSSNYIDENHTIIFDAKDPFATVNGLRDEFELEAKFKDLLTQNEGLYKSIAVIVDGTEYVISYDKKDEKVLGLDNLISDLRLETTMSVLASKNIKFVITLNDGVMNFVNDEKGNKLYTEGNTLTYNIVISTKINGLETLKKAYTFTKDYGEDFILKAKDGKILVLYGSGLKAADFFQNTHLIGNIRDAVKNDSRFRSAEIKIGNQIIEINSSSTIGASDSATEGQINYQISKYFKELLNKDGKEVYKNDAVMADIVKALGNTNVSITLNLKPTYATFDENNDTSVTYELVYSEYENLSKVFGANPFDKMDENKLKVEMIAGSSVNFATYFNKTLLENLFKGTANDGKFNNVSSITIDDYVVTAGNYASANVKDQASETNILVGNILDKVASYLKANKVNPTVTPGGNETTTGVTASIDELVKNKVELKFTVRMANGILSENGNSEETYSLTFAIQKNV